MKSCFEDARGLGYGGEVVRWGLEKMAVCVFVVGACSFGQGGFWGWDERMNDVEMANQLKAVSMILTA